MKLIDDKGMIFGKINIIDLFALVLIAVIVIPTPFLVYNVYCHTKFKSRAELLRERLGGYENTVDYTLGKHAERISNLESNVSELRKMDPRKLKRGQK